MFRRIGLAVAATLSLLVGAYSSQGSGADQTTLPGKLFAQAKAEDFIGSAACGECHGDVGTDFHKSGHATFSADPKLPIDKQGCEGCHGPGAFHIREEDPIVLSFSSMSAKDIAAACLRCHGDVMTNNNWHRTIHGAAEVACTSCHGIHPASEEAGMDVGERNTLKKKIFPGAKDSKALLKKDEASLCNECHASVTAKFRQNSHHPIPEGKMVCSDCHSPHPVKASLKGGGNEGAGAKNLNLNNVKHGALKNDMCVTCHGEVAGPFVFTHDPVQGFAGDGCAECHDPHGSTNPKMLKGFSRGLCAQCHTDKLATHFPGRTCWTSGCHVAVHGSNTSKELLNH